jgi:hypothetical protein
MTECRPYGAGTTGGARPLDGGEKDHAKKSTVCRRSRQTVDFWRELF